MLQNHPDHEDDELVLGRGDGASPELLIQAGQDVPGNAVVLPVEITITEDQEKKKKEEAGVRERVQGFEGVCIGRRNAGLNSSFTVRRVSFGQGVERIFPLYSPKIESIQVVRRGDVRRSKLYYLRGLSGKASRISERITGRNIKEQKTEG